MKRSFTRFERFAAIDWSGAKGKRHKGIAVALCGVGAAPPVLVQPGHIWSRTEVLDWLLAAADEAPTLFGFDFCAAPPVPYLPGEAEVPAEAKAFWAYVDRLCGDEDLGAASFLETAHRRHFYFGAADGAKRDFLRHRACEAAFNATGGGKASSVYDAIGAAQVAKASFAGMRLLHALAGRVPVWPMDMMEPPSPRPGDEAARSRPDRGSVVVEIYTRAFIRLAGLSGRKIRDRDSLNRALGALDSRCFTSPGELSDHDTDVLIASAGLRCIAANAAYWSPRGLTPGLARTEGWTFGVA